MSERTPQATDSGRTVNRTSKLAQALNENLERYLLLSFYVYIIAIIGIEVFRRFVLNNASLWGEETARYMFIYLTWIGASWGVNERLHIRIDILHQYVSERVTGLLYILGDIVTFAFVVVAIRWTIPQIQTQLQFGAVTEALRVDMIYFQVAVPIGMTLLGVRVLQALYRDVQDVRAGRPVYKGEELFS
ncbi:TRAP transporter small permease [Haloarcula nitratireducens]|uniref:TRAP transporter small permease n=1 Tax=Haloarcula nitratireducens TaxID=2487749 RepID=A0AAW4PHS4_9EURY|nr:TRAP transporter small permease [Halomicroarcula nitratireducens]MBX0297473.1 TRAP transporter small permease [Halomicroarcula nitratireducens]